MAAAADHPYVPRDLHLPGYVPGFLSIVDILVPYLLSSLVVTSLMWFSSGCTAKLTKTDRLLMCWWIFTGLTHIILEGYFAFSPEFYKEKTPFFLAEVWKEYSKGDSRYAARDSAVVVVEGITAALEGPASLLAVYIAVNFQIVPDMLSGRESPAVTRFSLLSALASLYGCLVYFLTACLEGDNFSTSPLHYWGYYIGANSSWVVIPTLIAIRSWKKISESFSTERKLKGS